MKLLSIAIAAVVAATTACSVGRPPGFSEGTTWTFPLVDPLNDGLLVTPVYIKGQGPYLFAIDPEANVSIIDERVAIAAELLIDRGYTTRLWGEDGERRIRFNAELRDLQIGNLYVETRRAIVVPHETLSASGRPIMGVLGRNVIADSLVFGFDRDRGVAWLQVASTFKPAPGASRIDYDATSTYTPMATPLPIHRETELAEPENPSTTVSASRAGVTDNKAELPYVHAKIDGRDHVVGVQLGSAITRLRDAVTAAIDAPARPSIEFDATGARRVLQVAGSVHAELAAASNGRVAVARYVDRSELPSNEQFVDGTIGLDFFAPFDVVADWPNHAYYVSPRDRSSSAQALRLSRWTAFEKCAHPGCVSTAIEPVPADAAPTTADGFTPAAPAEPPVEHAAVMRVTRDAGAIDLGLEVRMRAAGAPDLVVDLPASINEVAIPIAGTAHYEVIDASPFAVPCADAGGCAFTAR
jgi:hypothetical protein